MPRNASWVQFVNTCDKLFIVDSGLLGWTRRRASYLPWIHPHLKDLLPRRSIRHQGLCLPVFTVSLKTYGGKNFSVLKFIIFLHRNFDVYM